MTASRLEQLRLEDFTGGLALRRHDFNVQQSESPELLNVEIDPRGGFQTRRGWRRWNGADIGVLGEWAPRNAEFSPLSTGAFEVYVASNGKVYSAGDDKEFAELVGVGCGASPHLADFCVWGDTTYIACGREFPTWKRDGVSAPVQLNDASLSWNDDYDIPQRGHMPQAEHMEAHAGYIFVADTKEQDGVHRNRIRWSHPDEPEDWSELDKLDIEVGGGKITGLRSFDDHLVIFKDDSVWALYGYDLPSWQLVKKSRSVGAPSPAAIARSEQALFFYSSSGKSGIYAYGGGQPAHLTEKLRPAMEGITQYEDVWVAWVGRRLWCCVPWVPEGEPQTQNSVFVMDPEVGQGAWVRHTPAQGELRCPIERSDIQTRNGLAATYGAGAAALVELGAKSRAEDEFVIDTNVPFHAIYTTRWLHVEWPDRRKSWRRARFVTRRKDEAATVRIDAYHDYRYSSTVRSGVLTIPVEGAAFWTAEGAADPDGKGFDWGDGTVWRTGAEGGDLRRGTAGFGVSRSIRLKFSSAPTDPGAAWGIDSIIMKFVLRRFTT